MTKKADKDVSKSNYTVKLEDETKEELEKVTDEVVEKFGLKLKGDAYPIFIDLIKKGLQVNPTPEVKDYTRAITSALELIQSNLDCINRTFSTFKAQQEAELERQTKDLRMELKETKDKLKKARERNTESYKALKEAENKIKILESENKQLREVNASQQTLQEFKDLYANYNKQLDKLEKALERAETPADTAQ